MTFNKLKSIKKDKKGLSSGMALLIVIVGLTCAMYLSTVYEIPFLSDFTDDVIGTFEESLTNEEEPPFIYLDFDLVQTSTGIIIELDAFNREEGGITWLGYDLNPSDVENGYYHINIKTNAPRIVSGNPYQIIVDTKEVYVAGDDVENNAVWSALINDGTGEKNYQWSLDNKNIFAFEGVVDNWTFNTIKLYSPTGLVLITKSFSLE